MTTHDRDIVSTLRARMVEAVGQPRFEMWFGANTRLELERNTVVLRVPTLFHRDFLRRNLRSEIQTACEAVLSRDVALEIRVDPSMGDEQAVGEIAALADGTAATSGQSAPIVESTATGARTLTRDMARLETYAVGPSNRLAHTSAQLVAQNLGRYCPLLLHGPTGVGKTHLLEGIWSSARRMHPGLRTVYLTAEQFTSYFLEALKGSGLPSFRHKYRGVQLLIIDDIQFFAGKKATLGELAHTINAVVGEGRQMVLASDRPPAELRGLGQDVCTRLEGGLVCRIDQPEYETRLGIAKSVAGRLEVAVPESVLRFLATQFTSHARELIGALNHLEATSQAHGEPVSLAMAEDALAELMQQRSRIVRLVDIERAVCHTFGLEESALRSTDRAKRVSYPRMLAMWLARKHTRAVLSEIGEFFGDRSHSTVISAHKRVAEWMQHRAEFDLANRRWRVDDVIRQVESAIATG